jgi:hypothetical protein
MKTRYKLGAVVLGLALSQISHPQANTQGDHAPKLDQCQADLNLWTSQIVDYTKADRAKITLGTPNNTVVMKLSMRQIEQRMIELGDCASVDSSQSHEYYYEARHYMRAFQDRYESFVERHGLVQQLYKEDDAGLR